MEFFKNKTNIDYIKQKKIAMIFSILIAIFSSYFLITNGLNLGLDFTGGTQLEVTSKQNINIQTLREQFDAANFHDIIIQTYGSKNNALIRIGSNNFNNQQQLKQKIKQTIGTNIQIVRSEYIGPQVGKTLLENGILAIVVSLLATMLYIAIRFEFRFAISAAVSLIHDPVLILGFFAFYQLEFNLISLAAILTILGYSLNDTIVVYDRVRENFKLFKNKTPSEIINLSINETLSRTLITSGVTLLVVIALCLLGGSTLQDFAIALILGIIIGTYSSIYVAGSLAVFLGLNRQSLLPEIKSSVLQV